VIPGDFGERLRRRLDSLSLDVQGEALGQFELYFRLLSRWNGAINLTSLPVDEWNDQAIDRLLVEPLLAAQFVPEGPIRWFDLGSGGGSPAVPMKILRSQALLTMVEARERKAAFLREVTRTIGLAHTNVQSNRFEDLADQPGASGVAGLITSRAVRLDAAFFDAAAELLSTTGVLLVFASDSSELHLPAGLRLARRTTLLPGDSLFHVKQSD